MKFHKSRGIVMYENDLRTNGKLVGANNVVANILLSLAVLFYVDILEIDVRAFGLGRTINFDGRMLSGSGSTDVLEGNMTDG
jgi:hypothetical protein